MQSNRIWFLQIVRAIACITIVYVHWVTFIQQPNSLSEIYQSPLLHYPSLAFNTNLSGIVPDKFREAFFALGLFFIISGYVIPFSLENVHPLEFLVRRVMRIFPTLVVCLLLTTAVITLGRYLDGVMPYQVFSLPRLLDNLFLIRDIFHEHFIENGTWTLEIEIHFYALCFLLAFFDGYKKASILLSIAVFLGLLQYVLFTRFSYVPHAIGLNSAYFMVMFIGTSLFNWQQQYWSGKKTILTILTLLIVFNRVLYWSGLPFEIVNLIYDNSIVVLLLFTMVMLLNAKLIYSAFLNKVAEISYPLYLIHGFTGYVFYMIFYRYTESVIFSFAITSGLVLVLTYLVHYYVEKPSIKFAKRIAKMKDVSKEVVAVNT